MISVIIPCKNEAHHIARCLQSLLSQELAGDELEILIFDGESTDETPSILRQCQLQDPRIHVFENPGGNKSRALNQGIARSSGDPVVRADAHATYAPDYLRRCKEALLATGASNVGGLRVTLPQNSTPLARAIALSIGSAFGAGDAVYRVGAATPRRVDTVFGGCFPRRVFAEVGPFDERLLRGQDREFNDRIRRVGGTIWFDPAIRCFYYARGTWTHFIQWTFASGMAPMLVSRITGTRVWSRRNLIPATFVAALVGLPLLASLHVGALLVWGAMLSLYATLAVRASVRLAPDHGDGAVAALLPVVFFVTHVVYGFGTLWAVVRGGSPERAWTGA